MQNSNELQLTRSDSNVHYCSNDISSLIANST